jgi:hypothetical protein
LRPRLGCPERWRIVSRRVLEELLRRRSSCGIVQNHNGVQFRSQSALTLLVMHWASMPINDGIASLFDARLENALWSAFTGGDENFWVTATVLNALVILGIPRERVAPTLQALLRARPLESLWFASLKFRLFDRHVAFSPQKYGWPWIPDTISWVAPTAMALIGLRRARNRFGQWGTDLDRRLRLGTEMLLDRVCPQGGWNAGNGVAYGVALLPHIETTALALAALRPQCHLPIVRVSLDWLLARLDCRSAYSLALAILALAAFRNLRADITPALDSARDRLASLVQDPHAIENTSTIALATLALDAEGHVNPFEVIE